jgi:predicted DNA-binding protein (MmcQ/YjbR family)
MAAIRLTITRFGVIEPISIVGHQRDIMQTTEDALIEHCRTLSGAEEDIKWKVDLVFSVGAKMFAAFRMPAMNAVAFKVDEAFFHNLLDQAGFQPNKYMARYFWVDVPERDEVDEAFLIALLTESHRLVAQKLSKKKRVGLGIE